MRAIVASSLAGVMSADRVIDFSSPLLLFRVQRLMRFTHLTQRSGIYSAIRGVIFDAHGSVYVCAHGDR